jgi:hypothetical protein
MLFTNHGKWIHLNAEINKTKHKEVLCYKRDQHWASSVFYSIKSDENTFFSKIRFLGGKTERGWERPISHCQK